VREGELNLTHKRSGEAKMSSSSRFVPLRNKQQLVDAIQANVERLQEKDRMPLNVISCRSLATNEILFQSQLESSRTPNVFWNGDGTGIYYRHTRRVRMEFDPSGDRVIRLTVDGKEVNVDEVAFTIHYG
jgi:hypothetical protein